MRFTIFMDSISILMITPGCMRQREGEYTRMNVSEYIKRADALDMFDIASSEDELLSLIKNLPAADVRDNVRGEWKDEHLLIAEIITDYIASCQWLSKKDQETLAHFRYDYCCIDSAIGEHRCAVRIERSPQSGLKSIVCDTCLQPEIYDLNIKKAS